MIIWLLNLVHFNSLSLFASLVISMQMMIIWCSGNVKKCPLLKQTNLIITQKPKTDAAGFDNGPGNNLDGGTYVTGYNAGVASTGLMTLVLWFASFCFSLSVYFCLRHWQYCWCQRIGKHSFHEMDSSAVYQVGFEW